MSGKEVQEKMDLPSNVARLVAGPIKKKEATKLVNAASASRHRRYRVLLVDEKALTRESIVHMLCGAAPDLAVTGVARWSGGEIFDNQEHDVVVFNIGGADLSDEEAVSTFDTVRAYMRDVPAILLSERDDTATALRAIRAGYRGYVPTTLTGKMLLAAIRLVMAGGTFVPPAIVQDYAQRSADDRSAGAVGVAGFGLTAREIEVLNGLRQGKSNKVIAYELNISISTVKIYVRNIMKKLKATNRTQVAFLLQRLMSIASEKTSGGAWCSSAPDQSGRSRD